MEIVLLGLGRYAQVGETLLALMEPQAPPALQAEAARAVAGLDDPARGAETLARWRRYGPAVKEIVLDMLLRNQPFHTLLIEALERGDLTAGELDLDFGQRRRLLRRSTDDVRTRAAAFFTDHEFGNRQAVVDEWLPQVVGPARRCRSRRNALRESLLAVPPVPRRGASGRSGSRHVVLPGGRGPADLYPGTRARRSRRSTPTTSSRRSTGSCSTASWPPRPTPR